MDDNQYEQIDYTEQYHHEERQWETEPAQNVFKEQIMIEENNLKKLGQFSKANLENDLEETDIKIGIIGRQIKGSALSKYTVYLIKGEDKNGEINICRRFNQFHEMRAAMVKRWPGCFIPSIPSKNFIKKNDEDLIIKRQRYLNDYLKKVSKLGYLYYSQEFQALIRSKQNDISVIFSKWPNPTHQSIILRYKECFSQLAGKQINPSTNSKITQFRVFLSKNINQLEIYREMAKKLAQSRDMYDQNYVKLFSQVLPNYQKNCLFEYVSGKEQQLLYQNPNQAKLAQHTAIVGEANKKNPYWLLYDLIKHEERDARAALEALGIPETMQKQKQDIEIKIRQNQKSISQITAGKKNFTSITSRGSNEEIKYKLQVQSESLKKDKENISILLDIIYALIAYIEIDKYKTAKARFYQHSLLKLGSHQITLVQNFGEVWNATSNSIKNHQ